MELKLAPLTQDAFTPFGDVIEREGEPLIINNGNCKRFHNLSKVELMGENSQGIFSIFQAKPLTLPINLWEMESHPLGSQAFIPLSEEPFAIVVAPTILTEGGSAQQKPCIEQLQGFISTRGQGVNYFPGTWHHPLLALTEKNRGNQFLVVDRAGPGNNCLTVKLPQPVKLQLPDST